ncbi:cohesin subunit SA-1-like [Callorhinchus milii]|uniref:cohesin subunit SA-1-like n=1 Tax=Callorhinchus milii TaxID=7868 RepID=UPI001C3F67A1|nr:cohesin subunit SA-1-like [Callorhinchus milii]
MREVLQKHTDREVLETCSRAYYTLSHEDYNIHSRVDIARSQLLDSLVTVFTHSTEDLLHETGEPDEDTLYTVTTSLKRISALYNAHDLTKWELFDHCYRLVERGFESGEIPEQVQRPSKLGETS